MDLEAIRGKARGLLGELLKHRLAQGEGRRRIDYREFFPVDLETLVTAVLGWKLRRLKDFEQRARSDFRKRIIFLNLEAGGLGERRFSLAHEVGHAALHEREVECYGGSLNRPPRSVLRGLRSAQPPGMESLETDADLFAAELLMPAKPLREHFASVFGSPSLEVDSPEALLYTKLGTGVAAYEAACAIADCRTGRSIPSLTEQFGASRSAMARRLVKLGLVRNGG